MNKTEREEVAREYIYDTIIACDGYVSDCDNEKVGNAIKNGTPLPKEHGRPASPMMARSQVKEINGRVHKLKCYHVPMPDFKREYAPGKEK